MTTDEPEIWKKLNECEVVKKVKGEWLGKDMCTYRDDENPTITQYHDVGYDLPIPWIPPLYDPVRPERSLIGIANSIGVDAEEIYLIDRPKRGGELKVARFIDRPDLELAKAIIEQEGK